ncbi:hypothetical protein CPB85DRAFT_1442872 [Mucidula mucida]|nr:hypothetical protein CPB85DRAFT_1442872 [Mucidula mucida]
MTLRRFILIVRYSNYPNGTLRSTAHSRSREVDLRHRQQRVLLPPSIPFSHSSDVVLQHAWSTCQNPNSYRFTGLNAVRSYFDLLSTHYERSCMMQHAIHVGDSTGRVVIAASVKWTWKSSRHHWQEDYTCYIDYDATLKVVSFIVVTTSGESTCVMRAVDPGSGGKKKKIFDMWTDT